MIKKLEILTNVAVIVTSVVLCSVLAKNYLFSASKQSIVAEAAKPPAPNGQRRQPIQPARRFPCRESIGPRVVVRLCLRSQLPAIFVLKVRPSIRSLSSNERKTCASWPYFRSRSMRAGDI